MRTINFRDGILFALAYEQGYDPLTNIGIGSFGNLPQSQADAYASFASGFVRRLWDAEDWPEWTYTRPFSFQSVNGLSNYILWTQIPDDFDPNSEFATLIGTVLEVYLVDPRTTLMPVDTPFRLYPQGIHCGFEHGPTVWIKYRIQCPSFTATPWSSLVSFSMDQLTYSPITGECYKSRASGNVNNDPSNTGVTQQLPPQTTQEFVPGLPATPVQKKRIGIDFTHASPGPPPPDPVLDGSTFVMTVLDAPAGAVIGSATVNVTPNTALATVLTSVSTGLSGTLPGTFTVGLDTTLFQLELQNASDFVIGDCYWLLPAPNNVPHHVFSIRQEKPYIPAQPPVAPIPKTIVLTLSSEQVIPGATYTLNFLDSNGFHVATYISLITDGITAIISGLFDAISAQTTDTFFPFLAESVQGTTMTFRFNGDFSLSANLQLAGASVWWQPILFPWVLTDQVLRGTLSKALREQGQFDKADGEEQKVVTEEQLRSASIEAPQYDRLTDQQKPTSRYSIK